jgi:hypothetical protein
MLAYVNRDGAAKTCSQETLGKFGFQLARLPGDSRPSAPQQFATDLAIRLVGGSRKASSGLREERLAGMPEYGYTQSVE